jgi:hypothetical protein
MLLEISLKPFTLKAQWLNLKSLFKKKMRRVMSAIGTMRSASLPHPHMNVNQQRPTDWNNTDTSISHPCGAQNWMKLNLEVQGECPSNYGHANSPLQIFPQAMLGSISLALWSMGWKRIEAVIQSSYQMISQSRLDGYFTGNTSGDGIARPLRIYQKQRGDCAHSKQHSDHSAAASCDACSQKPANPID